MTFQVRKSWVAALLVAVSVLILAAPALSAGLVERGADLSARDKDGRTPAQVAAQARASRIAEVLRKAGRRR